MRRVGFARLHIVRPAHRTDAGRAIGEGNEPKPAMVEPENADMALGLAHQPRGAGKMAEDGGAIVFLIAFFDAEMIGQKSIAAGGVHHELRAKLAGNLGFIDGGHGGACAGVEFNAGDFASFVRHRPFGNGVFKQDVIEIGTAHLICIRKGFVPGIGKI